MRTSPTMGEIWVNSQELDPDEVRRTGCFTSLPVRVHKRGDIVDDAVKRLAIEWADVMGDGNPKLGCESSDRGNYASYLYPESRPERFGLVAYFTELAFIHDGW
jgi:ophiobolin F synthase